MDFSLSPEQLRLREEIVRFSRTVLNPGAGERDLAETFSRELWCRSAELGLLGLPVPAEYGGAELDAVSTAIALEALGYGCEDGGLTFSICAHLLSCVVPLARFGSEAQKKEHLPGLCNGSLIGVHAMTEPEAGSDAFNIKTVAKADGNDFLLTGHKCFISNAPLADLIIVFAVTDATVGFYARQTAFLVPARAAGVRLSSLPKLGLRTGPFGEVSLEDVRVPRDAVLGGVGGGVRVFMHSMDWERTLLFATHVGMIERVLEGAIEHARTRKQFGQPIGKFQAIAHKIADMKVSLEAARLLIYRAAASLDGAASAGMWPAIAKLFVSEALVSATLAAMQIRGGAGYVGNDLAARMVRDALGSTIYSGTSEIQRNNIARLLGL